MGIKKGWAVPLDEGSRDLHSPGKGEADRGGHQSTEEKRIARLESVLRGRLDKTLPGAS